MQNTIQSIVEKILVDNNDIYLVDIQVVNKSKKHIVEVYLETDKGITLDECSMVSKKIDQELEELDLFGNDKYTIEVSSPGLDRPLLKLRQYKKAVGKEFSIDYRIGSDQFNKIMKLMEVNDTQLHFENDQDVEIVEFENIVKATYHLKW